MSMPLSMPLNMRFDAIAAEILEKEETYLACVTKELVEKGRNWSLPVQYRFVENETPGVIDIEIRQLHLVDVERVA